MNLFHDDFRAAARHGLDSLKQAHAGLLVLLLLFPSLLLLLAPPDPASRPVRIAISGSAADPRATERLVTVLEESSHVHLTRERGAIVDPLGYLRRTGVEMLLGYEGKPARLSMYTAETDPRRIDLLERTGAGIVRAEALITRRFTDGSPAGPLFASVWWARPALYEDLIMLGTLPVNPLAEYYPQAADPRAATLSSLLLLTIALMPFALAIALSRTPMAETAGLSGSAYRISGRAIVPAAATLLQILVLLLVAEVVLEVHVKAGVFRIAALLFVTGFTCALLGAAIAAWCRSALPLTVACLCYGVPAVLLTQMPHAHLGPVAWLFPATYVTPVLNSWLFGAPYEPAAVTTAMNVLVLAAVVYGLAVPLAVRGVTAESKESIAVTAD